jgi:hypothetical protein
MHQYAPVCTSMHQNALKYKNFHFKQNVSKLVCTSMRRYALVCTKMPLIQKFRFKQIGMHQYALKY